MFLENPCKLYEIKYIPVLKIVENIVLEMNINKEAGQMYDWIA